MRRLFERMGLAAASLTALAACAGPGGDEASSAQAIVGGQIDPNDPAVVALLDSSNVEHCTGTLVAPGAILTAGHCAGGSLVTAVFGQTTSSSRRVAVKQAIRHPLYSGAGNGYDVGLLLLSAPVTDIAPVTVAWDPLPASAVGTIVRHVGFGDTYESDTGATSGRGTKETVSYPITIVEPLLIWSGAPGEQTCNGDSGGPALVNRGAGEQIVAVVSDGPNCHDPGNDARVDVPDVRSWIATNAPLAPVPPVGDAAADAEADAPSPPAADGSPPGDGGGAGQGGGCAVAPSRSSPTPLLVASVLAAAWLVRARRRRRSAPRR